MQPSDPVSTIPLVGPRYTRLLEKLGIQTIRDLLLYIPTRYDDFRKRLSIFEAVIGDTGTIRGTITATHTIKTPRRRLFLTEIRVDDASGELKAIWFNQPYLAQTMKKGAIIQLSGKIDTDGEKKIMNSPAFEIIRPNTPPLHTGRLVPIYAETRGISSKWLRSRIAAILDRIDLPDWQEKKPYSLKQSIQDIHFPRNMDAVRNARSRLAYDELLLVHAKALYRRAQWEKQRNAPVLSFPNQEKIMQKFLKRLPFTFTAAQHRVLKEIMDDVQTPRPMNRLLQGDVGSGKTVVATLAMLLAVNTKYAAILMAPTEILAHQHAANLRTWLAPFSVPVLVQTGSRKDLSKQTATPAVIVGTHALLTPNVNLGTVGLIVIDEQHRFGVQQRAGLRQKGLSPHVLTMTATPIPRTVALTLYGDLTVSTIDELPPGRKQMKTYLVPKKKREAAEKFIAKEIQAGRQAFIICPFIEPSESIEGVRAATAEYERLRKDVFPRERLALLHGRLRPREKNQLLSAFQKRQIDILVSTPVVEVGIDIPNATIMLIEGAERFGLAQLHQLRGRVGRGGHQSYCLLFSDGLSRDAYKRLKAFERHTTGMELAELDLKLRGPGEIYGTAQHGHVEVKIADLTNTTLVEQTRRDAQRLWKENRSMFAHPWVRHHFTAASDPN